LLAGIAGARLSYILQYPAVFAASPRSAFSLNPGLLDVWGGLAGAILALLIVGQHYHLGFWSTLDALTPLLAVLAIGSGLTNLSSGAGFGSPTRLPWGIELWGAHRHPTQIYETLAAMIVLALLWPGRQAFHSWAAGKYFLTFILLSGLVRLILETFRGDSLLIFGGLRLVQVLAWLVIAAALWRLKQLAVTKSDHPASKT
jgi:phosphatidylglycerol---prolipoprotein diacylglyceryl transferase